MVERLKSIVSSMITKYIDDYQNAGLKDTWVAGVNIPSKRNVRKAFFMNLAMIKEVAQVNNISDKLIGITDDLDKQLKDFQSERTGDSAILDEIEDASS
tara:strand:+ start:91 stop:387 length:297 start_codon:yes stop_codon:yes gene_type:complete